MSFLMIAGIIVLVGFALLIISALMETHYKNQEYAAQKREREELEQLNQQKTKGKKSKKHKKDCGCSHHQAAPEVIVKEVVKVVHLPVPALAQEPKKSSTYYYPDYWEN